MPTEYSIANALKVARKSRGLSQDAFSAVSSRTYMSTLERDLKSPTISKLIELCNVMNVHPLTLVLLAYSNEASPKTEKLLLRVQQEFAEIVENFRQ